MNEKKIDDSIGKKLKLLRVSPWLAGAIIGFLAASLQRIASMTAPPAYGFCMACHARDLINSIVNSIVGTNLGIAPIVTSIPTLTVIGVLSGSFFAAGNLFGNPYHSHFFSPPQRRYFLGPLPRYDFGNGYCGRYCVMAAFYQHHQTRR